MELDSGKTFVLKAELMDLTRDIHSLTEFKLKTPEFVQQLKATGDPLILTINGKAELVVQDVASYQKLLQVTEEARVLDGIRKGLEEIRGGQGRPLGEVFDEIRNDLKLPCEP